MKIKPLHHSRVNTEKIHTSVFIKNKDNNNDKGNNKIMKVRMVVVVVMIITTNITKHIYNCKQYESDSTRISSTYESKIHALEITDFRESPYKNVEVLS